jgi:hypothetical protein
LLALQRGAGNRAVASMMAASRSSATPGPLGGLVPGLAPAGEEGETQVVGGIDSSGPVAVQRNGGTATPGSGSTPPTGTPSTPPTTPPSTPPTATTIGTTNQAGPTWAPHGSFTWDVGFTTTGRSGWIVQEIVNTLTGTNSTGTINTSGMVPHYWEAWAVDGAGVVSPSGGTINDMWRRPSWGAGSKGNWSMTGNCSFTTTDPGAHGLTPGGVSNAGILLSGTSAPPDLGSVRLARHADGAWDSTVTTPTHVGRAGP